MALDLEERGVLDLNRQTRGYIPSLPSHHTHRLWHTLTNRSGVGHYTDHGQPDLFTPISTARDAIRFFENDPLVASPGSVYTYSTHAYSIAGAAIEAATGKSISQVVREEMQRHQLWTIAAEDRSAGGSRAALYNDSNVKFSRPDLSDWKTLGGGLEGSVRDVASFGGKLANGEILDSATAERIWSAPDSVSTYSFGFGTGTQRCTRLAFKSGARSGASSHLRIYPDENIAVACSAIEEVAVTAPATSPATSPTSYSTTYAIQVHPRQQQHLHRRHRRAVVEHQAANLPIAIPTETDGDGKTAQAAECPK
jgi:CubicO group peptidase (beta-lactamase class C family)